MKKCAYCNTVIQGDHYEGSEGTYVCEDCGGVMYTHDAIQYDEYYLLDSNDDVIGDSEQYKEVRV